MKLATVLIIIAANQGYWFGGREGTIALRAAVRGGLPAADVAWELSYEHLRLAGGKVALAPDDMTLALTPPSTRARITLHWSYRLQKRDSGAEIERGEIAIHVFPDDLMSGASQRIGHKRLIVWDLPSGLPEVLNRARVPFTRIASADRLQAVDADMLLVGPQAVGNSPFVQTPLIRLAEAGTSVMVFRQDGPSTLLGYDLATRDVPRGLEWRADHPLLNNFQPDDLQSWLKGRSSLAVVRLPADEPALEIGHYPREVAGAPPAPIDAVLLSKSVGAGRLVLCQLPLGDWQADPRSQIVLRNAIDYLLSPPQQTLRASERSATRPIAPPTVPRIPILSGDLP